MTPVSVVRSIALNRNAILPILRTQLEALEEASEQGTVVLAAGLPGSARIAVPVRVRVSYPAPKTPHFGITIAALKSATLYPRFRGQLDVAEAGAAATKLTLSGEYQVPFGIIGRAFDATAARSIAPRGLEDLVERLVVELRARVLHEADAAYRATRHSE